MNDIYLWNPRGRVTKVRSDEVRDLLGQGYLQPTEEELKRIEAGTLTYSHIYDRGQMPSAKVRRQVEVKKIERIGNVLPTEEI